MLQKYKVFIYYVPLLGPLGTAEKYMKLHLFATNSLRKFARVPGLDFSPPGAGWSGAGDPPNSLGGPTCLLMNVTKG